MPLPRPTCAALALLAVGAALSSCGSQEASTAPTARDRIVGAWELQSRTVQRAAGEVVDDPVLSERPIGRLFYSDSGHVALQMMRQGRAQAITEPVAPADARNARVVLGYDAYFGTFTVDEAAGTVTHHVQGSLFPEDLGKDFVRRFRVDGDTFELSFTSSSPGGASITRTLVFRRSR
jgi:Lipocalin-like domain